MDDLEVSRSEFEMLREEVRLQRELNTSQSVLLEQIRQAKREKRGIERLAFALVISVLFAPLVLDIRVNNGFRMETKEVPFWVALLYGGGVLTCLLDKEQFEAVVGVIIKK